MTDHVSTDQRSRNHRRTSGARAFAAAVMATLAVGVMGPAWADDAQDARALVEKAKIAFEDIGGDASQEAFKEMIKKAQGVLIFPQMLRAAFLVGASGGSGVALHRDPKSGAWNGPAFYTLGQASFGFQAGADAAEVVILAMTERGVKSMLNTSAKFGADASVAMGPVGAGRSGATANLSADLLAFSKSKGLYGGFSVDGGALGVRSSLNEAYYGKPVTPTAILVERQVTNRQAASLVESVAKLAGGK